MHTLAQLKAGELNGVVRLQLAENLSQFPAEIYQLADTLEVLDLSNNQLSSLPDDLPRLAKLRIIFLSNNLFTELPSVLAKFSQLTMIGFKANKIAKIAENSLPLTTRWLILTDNCIAQLPHSMGQLKHLEKLMLAGNKLSHLPDTMAACHALALVRLSANNFQQLPDWLFALPNIAWLAFSGNPLSASANNKALQEIASVPEIAKTPEIAPTNLQLAQQLGQGASGVIYQANWQKTKSEACAVAVKIFKGAVTSDGLPEDELQACLLAGTHHNLVTVIGKIEQATQTGLVMALIPPTYKNLGLPPTLQTCSRDTFNDDFSLSLTQIKNIMQQMQSVVVHLHNNGLCHGDLYAHNILINEENHVIFGDFGAASRLINLTTEQQLQMQKIELRALLYLLEDLLTVLNDNEINSAEHSALSQQAAQLRENLAAPSLAQVHLALNALFA